MNNRSIRILIIVIHRLLLNASASTNTYVAVTALNFTIKLRFCHIMNASSASKVYVLSLCIARTSYPSTHNFFIIKQSQILSQQNKNLPQHQQLPTQTCMHREDSTCIQTVIHSGAIQFSFIHVTFIIVKDVVLNMIETASYFTAMALLRRCWRGKIWRPPLQNLNLTGGNSKPIVAQMAL